MEISYLNICILLFRNIFSGIYLERNTLVRSVKGLCPSVDIAMEGRKKQRQRDRHTKKLGSETE
jgi:hypothetical protein